MRVNSHLATKAAIESPLRPPAATQMDAGNPCPDDPGMGLWTSRNPDEAAMYSQAGTELTSSLFFRSN